MITTALPRTAQRVIPAVINARFFHTNQRKENYSFQLYVRKRRELNVWEMCENKMWEYYIIDVKLYIHNIMCEFNA